MKNKKLILFDLDGTLIDSVPDLANAVNHTLKEIGYKTYSEDTIRQWVGNGASTLVKRALLGSKDINQDIYDSLFEKSLSIFLDFYSKNLCVKTLAYPNVINTLKELKQSGYILTIVTNKPYDFIQPIIKSLDIEELFKIYIGAGSLDVKKPDSAPLLYICEKLNISVEQSVMVGDSKNDIIAANSASMDSIGVTYGYNYGEDIGVYNPTFIIDDFKEIKNILG